MQALEACLQRSRKGRADGLTPHSSVKCKHDALRLGPEVALKAWKLSQSFRQGISDGRRQGFLLFNACLPSLALKVSITFTCSVKPEPPLLGDLLWRPHPRMHCATMCNTEDASLRRSIRGLAAAQDGNSARTSDCHKGFAAGGHCCALPSAVIQSADGRHSSIPWRVWALHLRRLSFTER